MKKLVPLCLVLAALLAASCSGKKEPSQPPQASTSDKTAIAPIIDTSKAKEIDARLADYDAIVTKYLADTSEKNADAVSADEAKLASVSDQLSKLATDFNPDQLKKYNDITAKLNS